jgi:heat shock protein HslJ
MFRKIGLMAAALAATLVMAMPAKAQEIFLQSVANNNFVALERGILRANGNADSAARLTVVQLGGGRVALRDQSGNFIRAGLGRETHAGIGGSHIDAWERFELTRTRDGMAIRAVQNGLYLEIDPRDSRIRATSSFYGPHAQFRMINAPSRRAPIVRDSNRPRFEWTGRWNELFLRGANDNLVRLPAGSRLDLSISVDRSFEVSLGCNRLFARLDADNAGRARFGPVQTTRMLCNNNQDRAEQALATHMAQVTAYEYREGQVAFLDRRGRVMFQIGR